MRDRVFIKYLRSFPAITAYSERIAAALLGAFFSSVYPAPIAPGIQEALSLDGIGVGGHIQNTDRQKYHP